MPGLLSFLADPNERDGIRQGFMDAVNRGAIGGLLGAPVDTANMLLNMGKAGVGYIGHKTGFLSADQMPELTDSPVGGSEWFGRQMQNIGMVSDKRNPTAEAIASMLPMSPSTSAKAVAAIGAGGVMPGLDAAMFIGPKAKTWNSAAAARALEMEKAGVPARQIWGETGTLRGPDGLLRQEIDDRSAKLVLGRLQPDAYGAIEAKTFDGALKHQQLKQAYPELNDVTFQHWPNESFQGASFDPSENVITLGHQAMKPSEGATLHELQHAIQQREGFAQGGNPEMFNQQKDAELARDALSWARELRGIRAKQPGMDAIAAENKAIQDYQQMGALEFVPSREARDLARQPGVLFDSPNAYQSAGDLEALSKMYGLDQRTTPYTAQEAYRRLAGEAEARATQARMSMTPAERRATFPFDSYDVPVNQLIARGGDGLQMAIDRDAKNKLIRDLQAGSTDGAFRLGDVTPGQANGLVHLAGAKLPGTANVMLTPDAFAHIYQGRVVRDGFTPTQVADVAEKALEKRARPNMDPASKNVYPSLVNSGLVDSATGRRFDAVAPLQPTDQSFNLVTVVPDGLLAPKKKPRRSKD